MTSTEAQASPSRVSIKPPDEPGGDWKVVEQDGSVVAVASTRGEARIQAREINTERDAQQSIPDTPNVAEEQSQPEDEVLAPSAEEEATRQEADRLAEELAAEHATVENDAEAEAAIANQHAEEEAEAPAEPAKAKKAKKSTRKTPDVPTVPTRMGALQPDDFLVRNDVGIVKVLDVSKTGKGQVEVAYEKDGNVVLYDSWAATHARRLHRPGEIDAPVAQDLADTDQPSDNTASTEA
jgi:hypothetical protein